MPKSVDMFWIDLLNHLMGGRGFASSVPPVGLWGSWCLPVPLLRLGWRLGRDACPLGFWSWHSGSRWTFRMFTAQNLSPSHRLISCITMQFFSHFWSVWDFAQPAWVLPIWHDIGTAEVPAEAMPASFETDLSQLVRGCSSLQTWPKQASPVLLDLWLP